MLSHCQGGSRGLNSGPVSHACWSFSVPQTGQDRQSWGLFPPGPISEEKFCCLVLGRRKVGGSSSRSALPEVYPESHPVSAPHLHHMSEPHHRVRPPLTSCVTGPLAAILNLRTVLLSTRGQSGILNMRIRLCRDVAQSVFI